MYRCLFLAVVLVLAGCSGVGLFGESPTPLNTPTDEELGPGLATNGVTDARQAANSHAGALAGRSYTREGVYTLTSESGPRLAQIRTVTYVSANRSVWSYEADVTGVIPGEPNIVSSAKIYMNETTAFQALTSENETYYVVGRPRELGFTGTAKLWDGQALLWRVFTNMNVTGVETVNRDGSQRYRIRGTGNLAEGDPALLGNDLDLHPRGLPEYTNNVRVTMYMAPDGVIRNLNLTWDHDGPTLVDQNGTYQADVAYTVRYTHIGNTSVERPAWTEAALNSSNAKSNG